MQYIQAYFRELIGIVLDMSSWLMLGFLIAGVLHVFFPDGKINRLLGKSSTRSVFRAALIGVPLPLCSCGVIPTGVSIYKNGASKGASVSFLISTPQTGVDSIAITYSMLGLPFAIIRPIVAFLTGILGGIVTNKLGPGNSETFDTSGDVTEKKDRGKKKILGEIFRYAFVDFMADIAKWLVIGLLIAALIAVLVPDDFFAMYIHNDFLGMLIILAVSVPLYICATSSVPIAAVLMMKGISPGAALVFLMAGPATIAVIGKSMGRKTLFIYLGTIITGALLSGLFIDTFLPEEWFLGSMSHLHAGHEHGLVPYWLQVVSAILITAFLLNIFISNLVKRFSKDSDRHDTLLAMREIKVVVRGMNCSHCKMTVETNLKKVEGIEDIVADVDRQLVTITGEHVDLDKVKNVVESIGYTYGGKVA
jgi:uncharacterized membrane protein YraQ (UPF0718 family)/copper chaperone CopZ